MLGHVVVDRDNECVLIIKSHAALVHRQQAASAIFISSPDI